jgi:hypothetical protein
MTTKAFDLATLIPNEAAVAGNTIVVSTVSPLNMDWAAMTAGGAFVPAASGANQTLVSTAGPLQWTTMQVPTDGRLYGLGNGAWSPVLPLTGGTLTGPLYLAADPAAALGAATRQYVDNSVGLVIDCGIY